MEHAFRWEALMMRGLYDAGAGLQLASLHQEMLSENLANSTMPGYRRHGVSFQQVLEEGRGRTMNENHYTSFTPGPLQQTDNPLDLAVSGDAFFTLDGPSGPVYTRNGSFVLNAQGDLQTHSGLRVSGQGGNINVPPGTRNIVINRQGAVLADGSEIGQLRLARFQDTQTLRRVGSTLFEGGAPQDPPAGSVTVEQGFKEGSNVDAVQEMVGMMIGMRQYEAAEKALRAMGDALALNTRPQS